MQYQNIVKTIRACERAAGRAEGEVTLLCVSKYHTKEEILTLYEAGQRDFGENKVQDLLEKAEALPKDIRWHLIGHLQTNKVKYIIGKTTLIHSLDSVHLAEEIEKRSAQAGVVTDCLVQLNSTGIEDRFGVPPEETEAFLEEMKAFPHIQVCGLMGMAPKGEDPDPYFRKLSAIFQKTGLPVLSMGMSGDFENAIQNGSTMVRIGRKVFA